LLPLLPLASNLNDSRQDHDELNFPSSDNEKDTVRRDLISRKRSESEKELVIYKTLNLEERRRLIKHHHKIRRYEN
jgi:hypothetical protein